ncbi:ARP2/3 complex 16 kDa subunit (p16-Arc) [Neoconidiobolus thromboides FSU 785]|nr:ARP2/3 complex 16 kDa subunit (p16-Arc) [Neoconidiobolus thromboides FSU 785]
MAFRQIDIDTIEGKRWVNSDFILADNSVIEQEYNERSKEVKTLLSKGKNQEALERALLNPPYFSDNEELKNQNLHSVMDVLSSFKSNQLPDVIGSLSPDHLDVLMKYVYRAMAYPAQFNSSVALTWHEKLVEANGTAAIVRVLTDYRTV